MCCEREHNKGSAVVYLILIERQSKVILNVKHSTLHARQDFSEFRGDVLVVLLVLSPVLSVLSDLFFSVHSYEDP